MLILASASPRRKELLSSLNIPFSIIAADISEEIDQNSDLEKEIEKLSYLKAEAIFKDHPDDIVIGSDTIVTIDNKVLGKPKDEKEAMDMLKTLSGKKHSVITAVSILSAKQKETFHINSDVYFDDLSEEEIQDYIASKEPMDKAGAYAIQGKAGKFIKKIDGDYYAIIGLPINELYRRLKKYL